MKWLGGHVGRVILKQLEKRFESLRLFFGWVAICSKNVQIHSHRQDHQMFQVWRVSSPISILNLPFILSRITTTPSPVNRRIIPTQSPEPIRMRHQSTWVCVTLCQRLSCNVVSVARALCFTRQPRVCVLFSTWHLANPKGEFQACLGRNIGRANLSPLNRALGWQSVVRLVQYVQAMEYSHRCKLK